MKIVLSILLLVASFPAYAASVSVSPNPATMNSTVTITVTGSTSVADWMQIVPKGNSGKVLANWSYLNGSKTERGKPSAPVNPATLTRPSPGVAGEYEVVVYGNGGMTRIASVPLSVSASGVTSLKCEGAGLVCDRATGDVTISVSGPGAPLCRPVDTVGASCRSAGESCVFITHPPSGPMVGVRVCDDQTLRLIEMPSVGVITR